MEEIIVRPFTGEEIARICDTTVEEIEEMIREGIFAEMQKRSKNQKDILGSEEEIKEIYENVV
ncbi:MAG: hypothetical protein A2271_05100 [Candidatus Moranbacteria bacterium RIFOXYA12_FULL_35_19]|nr:MAG: hypothetical protein UR78_C0018G0014 [Candidatus Moranbacteria bacterium GW2011_GWF2_35_39]OGI31009.1 MAG: hypothetical protein A2343_01980 [Candidatus Moranbacteria bacterium RIFOXYB12_FULL_35_8]OGI32117.1 MAG: hypothetical protein A2489_02060 [Candidatus Moranbacteria bacterium RIFOXYC12_FULL_36_13]OGI35085.1 MAG: hypothetical protein A2271_05100 [Candidatus Moranbacteria bacterium RIFOXYA12_FULL_35_19]